MERLRLDELMVVYRDRHGVRPNIDDVAQAVFGDDLGQIYNGKQNPVPTKRRRLMVMGWNNGRLMASLRLRHQLRLAAYFEVYDIRELISA